MPDTPWRDLNFKQHRLSVVPNVPTCQLRYPALTQPSISAALSPLFAPRPQWGMHPDVVVNLPTRPLESVPLLPPPPPAAVPVDDPAPAGRYVMRPITQSYLNGSYRHPLMPHHPVAQQPAGSWTDAVSSSCIPTMVYRRGAVLFLRLDTARHGPRRQVGPLNVQLPPSTTGQPRP